MSRMSRAGALWTLAGLTALSLPSVPVAAQEPPQPPPGDTLAPQVISEPELVFEREIFRYPTFQRRSPFRPLLGDDSGPRFEQMELRGVIYHPQDPRLSVALLSLRSAAEQRLQQQVQQQMQQQEAGTAPPRDTLYVPDPAQRVRVGQRWGNVRVAEIREDHVLLDVTEFGLTEQRILRMPVRRQGGPS